MASLGLEEQILFLTSHESFLYVRHGKDFKILYLIALHLTASPCTM